MKTSSARLSAITAAIALALTGTIATASPSFAAWSDGIPNQSDLNASNSGASGAGGWADMAGGLTARPYVQTLDVINGAATFHAISSGGTGSPSPATGAIRADVSANNLCRSGQAPAPGVCYATPNRVAIQIAYDKGTGNDGIDLASASAPTTVDSNTVLDMTVKLNTLGASLRWSWVNGDLLYWQPSNLGTADATLRIRFKPASTPGIIWDDHPGTGCTATPIFNCAINSANDSYLGASLLLSLDNTLDADLTGAVFATKRAFMGYLAPGGSTTEPTLDLQIASSHFESGGVVENVGRMKALIPARTLLDRYGVLPGDATSLFTTTRTGGSGSGTPSYSAWGPPQGSDGLLVDIPDITFSVPKYAVSSRVGKPSVRLSLVRKHHMVKKRKLTTVTSAICAPARKHHKKRPTCTVTFTRVMGTKLAPSTAGLGSITTRNTRTPVRTFSAAQLPIGARVIVTVKRLGVVLANGLITITT